MKWLKSNRFLTFKESFLQALMAFPQFLKNPIRGMSDLPNWDWSVLFALHALISVACGVLTALLSRNLVMIFTSFIFPPIVVIVLGLVMSAFFYYTFLFAFKREVSFKSVYTCILFASIPVLVTNIAGPIIPFIGLVGIVSSAFLLFVGFTAFLHLPEKKVAYLLGGLTVFYVGSVIYQTIRFDRPEYHRQIKATPESLDILEQELKGE